ncbi:MAG: alpha-glucosidase [Lachnospiraceae bacterium]|nr:alpha-glucosidase [Lachnospiraceae bacterium]
MARDAWYKDMNFYQIWIRSFKDGNGDGIGDLMGVYEKLDYIKSLGMDGIWFSPIYASPNEDFGYDISDYYSIHPDYGTMDDFDKVLQAAHAKGLKIIMDLVINHTSDKHPWFIESCKGKDNPYHDYYIWRPSRKKNKRPNNWDSLFEGKAWEYNTQTGEYYLHLFSKGQPDLNHANPKVREEIKKIMRFWLDKGVDGFREDVITFISKPDTFVNDYKMPAVKGLFEYSFGPHLLEYLTEYRQVALEYDCFLLGETPIMAPNRALSLIAEGEGQVLDMMFHFQHMQADCFMTDFIQRPFRLKKMKRAFSTWQNALEGKAWNTLYLENHDHSRIISRYGDEFYHTESGKMLAAMYLLQKGTAFVYQGQEIGMTNVYLENIEDYRDIQLKNAFEIGRKLIGRVKALEYARKSSRGSARTPVHWNNERNAGFTEGTPWFDVNPNYAKINIADQMQNTNSLWHFYRKLLAYRKKPVIRYGTYTEMNPKDRKIYMYERKYENTSVLVICSFSKLSRKYKLPSSYHEGSSEIVFNNYETVSHDKLSPYQVLVIEKTTSV